MALKLEVCCFTVESAIKAEKAGADRIEFCANHHEGGTTPSIAAVQMLVEAVKIPVNVIIRPRGGDFLYSDLEYEIIKNDVLKIKEVHANGVVVGFLKANGEIDVERTLEIKHLAQPMELTFHRAFDDCKDQIEAMEQLKQIGVKRVLTSGGQSTAKLGAKQLSKLVELSKQGISIMPAGGIRADNLLPLLFETKAFEYHTSALAFENSKMEYTNNLRSDASTDLKTITVNDCQIRDMRNILDSHSETIDL